MACDPNDLLEDAKCIMWCVPRGTNPAIMVSLLCQIASGPPIVRGKLLQEDLSFLLQEDGSQIELEINN